MELRKFHLQMVHSSKTQLHGVVILSDMHSNKNNQNFRFSRPKEERHPKFNRLSHKCHKCYAVENRPVVFVDF